MAMNHSGRCFAFAGLKAMVQRASLAAAHVIPRPAPTRDLRRPFPLVTSALSNSASSDAARRHGLARFVQSCRPEAEQRDGTRPGQLDHDALTIGC